MSAVLQSPRNKVPSKHRFARKIRVYDEGMKTTSSSRRKPGKKKSAAILGNDAMPAQSPLSQPRSMLEIEDEINRSYDMDQQTASELVKQVLFTSRGKLKAIYR